MACPLDTQWAGRRAGPCGAIQGVDPAVAIFFYRSPNDEILANLQSARNFDLSASEHLRFPSSRSGYRVGRSV